MTLTPRPHTSRPRTTTTLVVAAAGYGRTTWTEGQIRATVAEDLHARSTAAQVELLRRLVDDRRQAGSTEPLVLTSRVPLAPEVRRALTGPVQERGPSDLALTPPQVAAVLEEEYGLTDPELPSLVHRWTAGWPTLVHLCADAATAEPDLDELWRRLTRPGSAIASWWENDVRPDLLPDHATVAQTAAALDLLHPELVASVLADPGTTGAYATLEAVGLVVAHPHEQLVGRPGQRVVPLLAPAMRPATLAPEQWATAARWYADHDAPFAAAQAAVRAGDRDTALRLVTTQGSTMIAQGYAIPLVRLLRELIQAESDERPPAAGLMMAQALAASGDPAAAMAAYAPMAASADSHGWDAALATAVAAVPFSRGDLAGSRDVLDLVPRDRVGEDRAGILWRAARATLASMLGEDDADELAQDSLRLAEACGDPVGAVAAHQAVAKCSTGSRKAAHLDLALDAARRAGDAVALARILGNQAYSLLAAVRCDEAVVVGRDAVRAAELVRPMGALVSGLHNLAEALTRTGQYDEARWHLRRAAVVTRHLGAQRAATSMLGLAEIHRALGQREQGRAAYQEVVALTRSSGELQVLVPALSGLARLVVDEHSDEARTLAEEAVALAPPALAPYALVALGHVRLAAGDPKQAAELASTAASAARDGHALDLLADALELGALADPDPARAETALDEALSLWRAGGAGPDGDRMEVLIGRLDGADREARRRGREAAERLQRLGVTQVAGRRLGEDPVGRPVAVQVLGRFEVTVGGRPVTLKAWKSRQARTLVKVLAARRGRPVSRGELCEVLWPDDDPAKTSHRLSVLLTTVRGVLDPDKAWPPDRYVASDARGVWLDLRRVGIDAVDLIAEAEHGAMLMADERAEEARTACAAADRLYAGEAFEDEPYEDWAATDWALALKEETRAAWLRSLRHLATLATQQGRSNDASALLVRLLGVDPYDERVHRGLVRNLVRAGRHGEARRAFDRWSEAMASVDAPLPDPAELVPRQRPD